MTITLKVIITVFFLLTLTSINAKAVEYELPDLNDKPQSLDQYKGKWVIVNYWATWCKSCIKEIPHLAAIHNNQKIIVVGINYETIKNEQLKGFVEAYDIPYPVWKSDEIPVTPLGNVPALPTTYIIDPHGKAIAGQVGVMTKEILEDYIAIASTDQKYSNH